MLSVEYAIFSIPYFSIGVFITNTWKMAKHT